MRQFQGTIRFTFPVAPTNPDPQEAATRVVEEVARMVRGEVDDLDIAAMDVVMLPYEGVASTSMAPGVAHPWDQGVWIFPEGHPLSQYERAAYNYENTHERREAFLQVGRDLKLLPPPSEEGTET